MNVVNNASIYSPYKRTVKPKFLFAFIVFITQIIYNITIEIKQRSDTMSQRRDVAIKATEQAKAIHNLSPEEVEIAKNLL